MEIRRPAFPFLARGVSGYVAQTRPSGSTMAQPRCLQLFGFHVPEHLTSSSPSIVNAVASSRVSKWYVFLIVIRKTTASMTLLSLFCVVGCCFVMDGMTDDWMSCSLPRSRRHQRKKIPSLSAPKSLKESSSLVSPISMPHSTTPSSMSPICPARKPSLVSLVRCCTD